MPTISELKLELDDAVTMKLISQAFTEASASRVQKIKAAFENNKQFYEEISHLYHLVQLNGQDSGKDKKNGKKKPAEKKTVTVAVTSNQRFYGNLNINIMQGYLSDTESVKTDLLVIGMTGKDFLHSIGYARAFDAVTFVKDNPTTDETRAFLDRTKAYDTILMYYPKFVTLMTQKVGIMDITQAGKEAEDAKAEEVNILFEPEYTKTLEFFNRQVRSLLFLRVMLEADLSRTAARLMTMSSAEERSTEMIKLKKSQLRKFTTSITNARLLETFSAMKGVKK